MFRLFIFLGSCFFFLHGLGQPAISGNCLQDFRKISTGGHNLRLRDYYCRSADNKSVRVRFHRVTDYLANAILDRNLPAELRPLFGSPKLIDNEVYREFQLLMKRFGFQNQYVGCQNWNVIAAGKGQGMKGGNNCSARGTALRTIGGWEENPEDDVFPAAGDLRSLEYNNRIPRGYKSRMVKPQWGGPAYKAIWRYTKRRDFKNYKKKLRDYNALVTGMKKDREGTISSKYFAMLDYVTRKGVPRKFMVIHGQAAPSADCQGFAARWVLSYTERAMMLDLALIENTSSSSVAISQLLGAKGRKVKLRSLSKSKALKKKASHSLGTSTLHLAPGERALLFQRMAFIVPQKKQDGFKLPGYVYGPEVLLKGLELNGERLVLEDQSANFISFTAGDEGGSCPYLLAWSDRLKSFVNTGKMLNKAKGAALEQTDRRSFEGFISKFRIHEREPELAQIDRASLTIDLKNGEQHRLVPEQKALTKRDRLRLKLAYGEYVELVFKLPADIQKQDVLRSTIALTGYYDRYSTLLKMSRLNRPLELIVNMDVTGSSGRQPE